MKQTSLDVLPVVLGVSRVGRQSLVTMSWLIAPLV